MSIARVHKNTHTGCAWLLTECLHAADVVIFYQASAKIHLLHADVTVRFFIHAGEPL